MLWEWMFRIVGGVASVAACAGTFRIGSDLESGFWRWLDPRIREGWTTGTAGYIALLIGCLNFVLVLRAVRAIEAAREHKERAAIQAKLREQSAQA